MQGMNIPSVFMLVSYVPRPYIFPPTIQCNTERLGMRLLLCFHASLAYMYLFNTFSSTDFMLWETPFAHNNASVVFFSLCLVLMIVWLAWRCRSSSWTRRSRDSLGRSWLRPRWGRGTRGGTHRHPGAVWTNQKHQREGGAVRAHGEEDYGWH